MVLEFPSYTGARVPPLIQAERIMQNSQPEEPTGGASNGPISFIKRASSTNSGRIIAVVVVLAVVAIYFAQH